MADAKFLANLPGDEITPPAGLFVLFGCSGDLARRKIVPALYNLFVDGLLDERFALVGVSRRDWDDAVYRNECRQAVEEFGRQGFSETSWEKFGRRVLYQKVRVDEADDYAALGRRLDDLDGQFGTAGNRLFYVSMAPEFFPTVAERLGEAGLNRADGGFSRLVIEKPFGRDLASAQALNRGLQQGFDEEQIYRIDHYLGKETVQNILVFRFANAMFDSHLNAQSVQSVEITTAETVGMEGRRGPYYESSGALRDMIQNHMLQLLALTAMEKPDCLRCGSVRDAKVALLNQIRIPSDEEVRRYAFRGQYGPGDGPGYREESGVDPQSTTETYAAVRLTIDNDRWRGVPFYLRTGKRLAAKVSQINVVFRRRGRSLFQSEGCDMRGSNVLSIRIAPNEGISVRFDAKVPGVRMLLRPVKMDFQYETAFGSASPEAYEHLLLDAMRGDSTLFIRGDETEAAWRIVDPIRQAWDAAEADGLRTYEPESWGPEAAEAIFDDPYRRWSPM